MSQLSGYLDGSPDQVVFASFEAEAHWLEYNLTQVLDTEFLNSESLRKWAVRASHRMFGDF